MGDTVPPGRRIDRASLERILQRAAELQATERDLGEGLTEAELYSLGEEVGLSPGHLRQAIIEERTRPAAVRPTGLGVWLAGPPLVSAERILPQGAKVVSEALHWWMDEGEVMQVKRRFPDVTVWEARRGAMAAIRRSLRTGHPRQLARVHEVSGTVTDLGDGRCHVRLTADVSKQRREHVAGAIVLVTGGAVVSAVAIGIGVAEWAALLATPVGGLLGYGAARSQWNEVRRAEVALEQVLDRLEHGEITVPRQVQGPRPSAFVRIADEIKKSFGA